MPPRDIALALGVVLIWGLNFVAIKWGVDEIPPFLLTALRYLGCAFPAVFFIKRPQVGWPILLGRYPASMVAPFSLLVPVVGFAAAALLLGEVVSTQEILGSLLIFLGLLLNVFGPRLVAFARA